MKIKSAIWFSLLQYPFHLGIVYGIDEQTKERKAYIGRAHGVSPEADMKHIAENGAKINPAMLREVLNYLENSPPPD